MAWAACPGLLCNDGTVIMIMVSRFPLFSCFAPAFPLVPPVFSGLGGVTAIFCHSPRFLFAEGSAAGFRRGAVPAPHLFRFLRIACLAFVPILQFVFPALVPVPQFPHWFRGRLAVVQALRCAVRAALWGSRRCLACRCMESRPLIPLPLLPCRGVRGSDRPGPCWVLLGQRGSAWVSLGQRRSRRFRSVQTECVTFKRIAWHLSPIASGSFQIMSDHIFVFQCEEPPVWIIFSPRVWPWGVGRRWGEERSEGSG